MDFATVAKRWLEIRGLGPTKVMVENCGLGAPCRGNPAIRQRTACGTACPSYLVRTGVCLQCHRIGGSWLQASASQSANYLDVRGLRRRAILPRLFTRARSRGVRTLKPRLLGGYDRRFSALWFWSLL